MKKTIHMKLNELKARQENSEHMPCPRCGRDTMKKDIFTNALSRVADLMICDECGIEESKLAFMRAPDSLYTWAAFQPERPGSDFKEMCGEEAWRKLCDGFAETLQSFHDRFLNGEDPNDIRFDAFESLPGLTEFWTEPYRMDFKVSDGRLVITFEKNGAKYEMCGSMIEGGDDK